MNFKSDVFIIQNSFQWILIITEVIGSFILYFFVWFFEYKRLMLL
jgi:magnesium transporter